jgi:O-antigen ligase/polysaccharide polymerase Wzy-like membrane protein
MFAAKMPPSLTDSGRTFWTHARFIERAVIAFLALFAIALPFSIKGSARAWKIALVLWLIGLAMDRVRPFKQPLAAPLLAFVVLSAMSTILSPDPYLSWDRMKIVCLVLVGVVVAQSVTRLSQARWLAILFVLSGLAASLFTGWQYTYGIGVQLEQLSASSRLAQQGLRPNDIVKSVAGQGVHTPAQLLEVVQGLPKDEKVPVKYLPFMATQANTIVATADDFLESGLGTPEMELERGTPFRAQGTLGHYVVFAEMLMHLGCMAWALLLVSGGDRRSTAVFALAFAGIAAALMMTMTRADVAGLVIGCMLTLLILGKGWIRWASVAMLIVLVIAATLWIQHSRELRWDRSDVGTQFRLLMWQDGIRLVRGHPWFGVGMETVRLHWEEWNIRGFIQYHVQSHFHSTYLQIAVERGIPALLAWLWFCGAYLVFLVRLVLRLRTEDRFAAGVVAGVCAGFVAFSFTSLFHYNLGEEPIAMTLFFLYGLAVAVDRITMAESVTTVPAK